MSDRMKSLFVLMATGFLLTLPSILRATDDSKMGTVESSPPFNATPVSANTSEGKPSQNAGETGLGCEYGCDLYLDNQTICINKQQYKCNIRNWELTGKEC